MRRVLEALNRNARECSARVAIEDTGGRRWTCGELAESVEHVSSHLVERLGADSGPGATPPPVVAIELPSGGALWVACLAVVRAGFDALLLPERPHERLRARVARELAPVLVVDASVWKELATERRAAATCGAASASSVQLARMGGIVLVSSGTTGWSRFVRRTPECVDRIAAGLVAEDLFRSGECVGSFLPMHHAYGFEHAFVAPVLAGASVLQRSAFSVPVLEELLEAGATVLPLVPATLSALGDATARVKAHRLRQVTSAGSPLTHAARAACEQAVGCTPTDLYGATELGTIWLDRGQGGRVAPGVRVRIVDPEERVALRDMPAGAVGEIAVESQTRYERLLGAVPETDEVVDGWFRTGDLGVRSPEGGLRITGRLKLVFDVGGLKVNPFEVEAAMEEHPSIAAALVGPVEAAPGVLRVAARVELWHGCAEVGVGELRSFLAGRVPEHALPRSMECVSALARTPGGKILRVHSDSPVVSRPGNLSARQDREAWTQELFDSSAPGYDVSSGAAFLGTGRWYRRRMLRRAGLAPGMALLDVGSGTGLCAWIAQCESDPGGRVVALDPSPGMLEVARRRGVRETVVGRAEALPFAASTFDMVSMSYMLRHVDDIHRAFSEARRVLRPHGRIVILEVTRPPGRLAGSCFRVAMRHALPSLGVLVSGRTATYPMMRYWADTIEVAVAPEAILAALERAGFRGARHQLELGVFSCYRGVAV